MKRPEIKTIANLEAALAGESMAHTKYRYFAAIAREGGFQVGDGLDLGTFHFILLG